MTHLLTLRSFHYYGHKCEGKIIINIILFCDGKYYFIKTQLTPQFDVEYFVIFRLLNDRTFVNYFVDLLMSVVY
jgi:hypothetical protein